VTIQPAQVKALNGYGYYPIFTVGDQINNYVPVGIFDGIGAYSLNSTTVRAYVNHELGPTVGYQYSLKNGTQLTGGRVSYFDIDKTTFRVTNAGLAYDTIVNRAGNVVSSAAVYSKTTNPNGIDSASGFNRPCSAELFEANQFGAGKGIVDNVFFMSEESGSSSVYALDVKTNIMYALPWFGRAGFENVTQVDTGSTDKVAFIIGDDRSSGGPVTTGVPLLLYVGTKNPTGDFLARNGLSGGKLYAWGADDPTNATDPIEADPRQFFGNNSVLNGKFAEVKHYDLTKADTTGYDSLGFVTQATQDALAFNPTNANDKAFGFVRVEDVSTSPLDGTVVAFNATGNGTIFGGKDAWGTVYRIDIDFVNIATGDIRGKVDILNDGNVTLDNGLRSPDNLVWAEDGKIYLNEDPAVTGFGATSGLANSIFVLDPSVANPSSTLTRVAIADRSAAAFPYNQTDGAPTDLGSWETSGITDVSNLFNQAPGTLMLNAVQAHSFANGNVASQSLVEGGQLGFLLAPSLAVSAVANTVVGTAADDTLNATSTYSAGTFDGKSDSVFTGAGKDTVDVVTGSGSDNRIFTGSGADTIFANIRDVITGGSGDDEIWAVDGDGNRLSGGLGNDTFHLGSSANRALGGAGNDKFFVLESAGTNYLNGGAGNDQFWLVNGAGEMPTAKQFVMDFKVGEDKVGLQGITFSSLSFTQVGTDTLLKVGSAEVGHFTNIVAASLNNQANFAGLA
jgi:Ca2+-binding RTX toxin-like protein